MQDSISHVSMLLHPQRHNAQTTYMYTPTNAHRGQMEIFCSTLLAGKFNPQITSLIHCNPIATSVNIFDC